MRSRWSIEKRKITKSDRETRIKWKWSKGIRQGESLENQKRTEKDGTTVSYKKEEHVIEKNKGCIVKMREERIDDYQKHHKQ